MQRHQPDSGSSAGSPPPHRPIPEDDVPVVDVVYRNIHALLDVRREFEQRKSTEHRIADRITRFTGSMPFLYLHALLLVTWCAANLGGIPGVRPWDPFPFMLLSTIGCVEAIFLSTFVLISQNRMQSLADRRAELDLQVNLLAEHEVTRLITMVDAISTHLGVPTAARPSVEHLKRDVAPEVVLTVIEEAEGDEGPETERFADEDRRPEQIAR